MPSTDRIRAAAHLDPHAMGADGTSAAGGSGGVASGVRMMATGHLTAEDDEGNCEYKWRLTGITDDRFQHLVTQMKFRVAEGHGKCLYEIGVADDGAAVGLCDDDYEESLATVRRMADALGFDLEVAYERAVYLDDADVGLPATVTCTEILTKAEHIPGGKRRGRTSGARAVAAGKRAPAADSTRRRCAEIHVTRRQKQVEDLRIAFCGLGGAGKSTLVGVLTQGALDNGSGSVRSTVFNHKHEVDTGCTSSVTHHVMGFDAVGRVTNYDEERLLCTPVLSPTLSSGALSSVRAKEEELGVAKTGSLASLPTSEGNGEGMSTIAYAINATRTIAERSVRLVTLLDLGGQAKYSKTAYFGITSKAPGYACIVAAADRPVTEAISLHVSICLALRVPFCVVVTKCDTVGELELDDLQLEVDDYVRSEARAMDQEVRTVTCGGHEDALDASFIRDCVELATVPVFLTSCVNGTGIGFLKTFFHKLPVVGAGGDSSGADGPCEVLIDGCFNVPGAGPVLGGMVTKGDVFEGQRLLLGPDRHGNFQCVTVRGIHEKGSHVTRVSAGTDATFSVGHIPDTVDANRKGTILYGIGTAHPQVCMTFECRVRVIASDGAAVSVGQEPILHCRNIRQAVKLIAVSAGGTLQLPTLATAASVKGEGVAAAANEIPPKTEGIVLCRFLYHPEVLEKGSAVLMRWNRSVRVVGQVSRLVSLTPCTSPTMRPTPVDLFDPPELVSQMHLLPEEVDAIHTAMHTPHTCASQKCFGSQGTFPYASPQDAACLAAYTNSIAADTDSSIGEIGMVGAGLFGDDSDGGRRPSKRGASHHRRTPHRVCSQAGEHVDTPHDECGGTPTGTASSSEGMDVFGSDVAKKFVGHTTLLPAEDAKDTSTAQRPPLRHEVYVEGDGNSRTPEMHPSGTAEYLADCSML